jgi:hypothetical protein
MEPRFITQELRNLKSWSLTFPIFEVGIRNNSELMRGGDGW